ncbi:TLDc domain-containing protein [Entamoeba marina]
MVIPAVHINTIHNNGVMNFYTDSIQNPLPDIYKPLITNVNTTTPPNVIPFNDVENETNNFVVGDVENDSELEEDDVLQMLRNTVIGNNTNDNLNSEVESLRQRIEEFNTNVALYDELLCEEELRQVCGNGVEEGWIASLQEWIHCNNCRVLYVTTDNFSGDRLWAALRLAGAVTIIIETTDGDVFGDSSWVFGVQHAWWIHSQQNKSYVSSVSANGPLSCGYEDPLGYGGLIFTGGVYPLRFSVKRIVVLEWMLD